MSAKKEGKIFLIGWVVGVLLVLSAITIGPFWVSATSTYTDDLGQEMPARGDVGWDDAIRLNYKILEVITVPILEGHFTVQEPVITSVGPVITWGPGWVFMNDGTGVSKYLPGGVTIIPNNDTSWLSAITPQAAAGGVTMQVRTGEYNIPNSGGSQFAHVPIAALTVEANNVVRNKGLTFMAPWKYPITQALSTGVTPTFAGVQVPQGLVDASRINASSGISVPSGVSPTGTQPSGSLYVDTNDKLLQVGVAGTGYGIELEKTYEIIISSPDMLDNKHQIPLFTTSGSTFYITGGTIYCSQSGNSVAGIVFSSSQYNWPFGAGITIFNFCNMTTAAGTSVWTWTAPPGVTPVPPNRTVMADYGNAGTPDIVKIDIKGRVLGGDR